MITGEVRHVLAIATYNERNIKMADIDNRGGNVLLSLFL